MVTFIITLVITTLVTYIITSLYYRQLIRKSVISQEGVLIENIKSSDPTYAIPMHPNPAYGNTPTIKMKNNPAYATAKF